MDGDEQYLEKDYSIQEYCLSQIENAEANPKLQDLCKATLDYGTYAQLYFDHMTDDLANRGNYYLTLQSIPKDFAFAVEGDLDAMASYISSLTLKSKVGLNLFFKPLEGKSVTYSCSREFDQGIDSGYDSIRFRDISAKNLGDPIAVVVSDGTASATLTGSPLSVAYKNQEHATMGNLYKSLYNYYFYAKAYLG